MINIKDVLTLSDSHEYVVCGKTLYDGFTYYFLVDIHNNSNIKFCYLDGDELVETTDGFLNTKLLPRFMKSLNDSI